MNSTGSRHWGEHLALGYLLLHGLRLVRRNYFCRLGEIDLIMRDRSTLQPDILVFVEVRYRRSTSHGSAAATVTTTKQKKISRSAALFLKQNPSLRRWPARFDVVAIQGNLPHPRIRWLKAAFDTRCVSPYTL